MPKVLVVEPHSEGHRGPYLQWLIPALLEGGYEVVWQTTQDAMRHRSVAGLTSLPIETVVAHEGMPGGDGLSSGSWKHWGRMQFEYWGLFRRWYLRALSTAGALDIVFLPYLDYCLYAAALLGSPFGETPWASLTMRPAFHYRSMGIAAPRQRFSAMRRQLFFRLNRISSLKLLFTIDETLYQYLSHVDRLMDVVEYLPEPVTPERLYPASEARSILGLSASTKIILAYGSLSYRKGIRELIQAMCHRDFPSDVTVLLAGLMESDVKAFVQTPAVRNLVQSGRVILMDRFMELQEEALLFSSADVIWLGYRNHYGPSNVLKQAVRAKRPVISCREGITAWKTRGHRLGLCVDIDDKAAVAGAVGALTRGAIGLPASGGGSETCSRAETMAILRQSFVSHF